MEELQGCNTSDLFQGQYEESVNTSRKESQDILNTEEPDSLIEMSVAIDE